MLRRGVDTVFSASVVVAGTPEQVYDVVSDVSRTGEWSPVCTGCTWDEGAGPQVGAWFTGTNEVPGRTWTTRSQVVVAERGREFAWRVGGSLVHWSFRTEPAGDGTLLTESWEFLPDGLALFAERYGDDAPAQVADRTQQAREGIPVTLAALQRLLGTPG